MSHPAFEFEGAPVPAPDALAEALLTADRDRLVRAAVVVAEFADAVLATATEMLADARPRARAVGLQVAGALYARNLLPAASAALMAHPDRFVGVPDPLSGRTLAQSAVAYVVQVSTPGSATARRTLEWALTVPELRAQAWDALGADAPESVLPHLGELLAQAPELAESVATRFALVHTEHCEAACRAIAHLPEATRRTFADYLEKHLKRIFSVKRWVHCRQILFGR